MAETHIFPDSKQVARSRALLDQRTHGSFTLTSEFAGRVRAVVETLPPSVTFHDLDWGFYDHPNPEVGDDWLVFWSGLDRVEKGVLRKALGSLSLRDSILNPTQKPKDFYGILVGRRQRNYLSLGEFDLQADRGLYAMGVGPPTEAFLRLAFSHRADTEFGDMEEVPTGSTSTVEVAEERWPVSRCLG